MGQNFNSLAIGIHAFVIGEYIQWSFHDIDQSIFYLTNWFDMYVTIIRCETTFDVYGRNISLSAAWTIYESCQSGIIHLWQYSIDIFAYPGIQQ